MIEAQSFLWPRLREDLTLYPGPADSNGAPSWTLHDPVRNQYFELDWVAFEVVSRIALGDVGKICDAIHHETTLFVNEETVNSVFLFLRENELLVPETQADQELLIKRAQRRKKNWFDTALHGYLFFRIPLFKPDRFLGHLVPRIHFFFSRRFLELTIGAFLFGLWQIYRQWDVFTTTLIDTFSLEGIVGYAGALISVKVLHELGHALVAKRCGCRVPTMGVAFLVMWPMAYTDVTESWKLNSHRKRLSIASAGILTELIVAAWSLFLWGLVTDGSLRSICFFLGTTSIVATLAINASPFMRFDGYFLLSDILGIANLHQRSFAYTRSWLRNNLLGLHDPYPEVLSKERQRFFLAFALITWIYRLIVFTGIAIIVYQFFFKALGILLFLVEIWFFILKPVMFEIGIWHKRWDEIAPTLKRQPVFYILVFATVLLVLPLDLTVNAQGILKPDQSLNVIAPLAAEVQTVPPAVGARIEKGTPLVSLVSSDLDHKIKKLEARMVALDRQVAGAGFDQRLLAQRPILQSQHQSTQEELSGLQQEQAKLRPIAPFNGVVIDADPDLSVGQWVPKGFSLLTFVNDRSWVVDCFVEESDLKRLDVGNWGRFIPDGQGLGGVGLRVIRIDKDATRVLTEGALASVSGGDILVRTKDNKNIPERSVYRVRLQVDGQPQQIASGYLRGKVVVLAWPKSVLGDVLRSAIALAVRETGF